MPVCLQFVPLTFQTIYHLFEKLNSEFFFPFLPAHVLWRGNPENDEKEKKSPAY